MSRTRQATVSEIAPLKIKLDGIEANMTVHFARSFATAHQTLSGFTQSYTDSNREEIGEAVLEISEEGITRYVPCRIVSGDVPSS